MNPFAQLRLLPVAILATLAGALVSCGGREHAALPPPAALALTVTDPAEGVTLQSPTTAVRGRVTGGRAILGLNGQRIPLAEEGGFDTRVPLLEGENQLVFDVWPESVPGRGSDLLPNTPPALHLVRRVLFAWPSLSVQFTAPNENSILKSSPAPVTGLVSEPASTVSVNGVPALVDADGRFTASVPLVEGPNTLVAQARTTAGLGSRNATASRHITFAPPVAPRVHIVEPAEGLITSAAILVAKGTVSDPASILKVNGQPVAVAADGAWSVSLAPAEGPFTLSAEATQSDGLTGADARHLTIDRTPPRIDLDATPPTPTRLTQLPLAGKVADATACQLWVEDAATGLTGPPPSARFSTSIALAEGANTVHFRAVDAAGNVGTLLLTVTRDTEGPGITLDPLPPDGECSLQVSGRASDASAVVTFTRDGAHLPSSNNAFAFAWALSPGSNSTTLRATDALGNASELVLTRTCASAPPPALTLTVTAPLEGQSFTQPSAPIAGRVSDPTASVAVNGAPLPVASNGSFSGTAPLVPGPNLLAFTATASEGRLDTAQRHVTYDPGGGGGGGGNPPVITFDDPLDGFATSARSLTVLGHVDDPKATLKVQGLDTPMDDQGRFRVTITPGKEGVVGVRAEAVNAYGTSRNAMYVSFQWSSLRMVWADPTPPEGARLTTPSLISAVTLSRAALVDLNGQAGALEPNESGPHPFRAQADLIVDEGLVVLTATAVDGGGNRATLARNVAVGLTAPTITFNAPAFEPGGTFRTMQTGIAVSGTATAPDAVKPLTLTLNGQPVALDAKGAFSWTFSELAFGPNAIHAVAANAFGQKTSAGRSVERVQDGGGDQAPKITVESPLEGFATGSASLSVVGRVNRGGLAATMQGRPVNIDPLSLRFTATVDLAVGNNTIVATAMDGQGRSDSATIHGTRFAAGQSKYRWDFPVNGARLASHSVLQKGQADQPGIQALSINGASMALSGNGASAAFQGNLVLPKGPQTLLLEALTVAGERLTERRDILIDPPLPRILLDAPASARPGDQITLTVKPAPGTILGSADLSWNGGLLAHLLDPFPAQAATVPADSAPGTKLLVEAVGTDLEGETVTARTYVVMLSGAGGGGGPLMWSVLDDRTGLVLPGAQAQVATGDPIAFGDGGLATLPSMLPDQWVKASKSGFTPQWRHGNQAGAKAQALFDARLTPLDPAVDAAVAGFSGSFAKGAFQLTIPDGALSATGKLSVTPLSTQGLPGLLPRGWSAVSALWAQLEGANLTGPATLKLTPPAGTPDSGLAWARFDEAMKAWVAVAVNIEKSQLTALSMPKLGGYALLVPDPAPVAPPVAAAGQALVGTEAGPWRAGLAATGAADPSLLPTSDAINGARAVAKLDLGFAGQDPVASGTAVLAEIVETYTRVDLSLIEPEKRAQDGVVARFVLGVDQNGAPGLRAVADGVALELPVRMSRTFQAAELVEGLIQVGFYHEDQVIAVGGELIGAGGGSATRDGITAVFADGAFASSTLVRVQGDPATAWEGLWPELKDLGRLAASFAVDLGGTLQTGMTLSVAELGEVPSGLVPLLVQRRIVADQRVVIAVGALEQKDGAWKLVLPAESNPILEGGAFAVLVPTKPWSWVTGTVSMPRSLAAAIQRALAAKNKTGILSPIPTSSPIHQVKIKKTEITTETNGNKVQGLPGAIPAADVQVKDAMISGNWLQAASGANGLFAVPAMAPATGKLNVKGERWDLGLTGTLNVDVPSSGLALRLATIPFAIQAILPQEGAVVDFSAVFTVLATTPMDPSTLTGARLFQKQGTDPNSTLVETSVRRQLSIDGRTLLVAPDQSLVPGADYNFVVEGLKSLAGEAAPRIERKVSTVSLPPPPADADFTRITLGYPDANFNVPMTLPAGAVPAGASILIEGLGMGYTYSGTMPNGELRLTLRASLGERIRITVQIAGRTTIGHVSRYESGDGSGRVTIGMDGGRVEAAESSGAAVVIPVGSLIAPAEFMVSFTTELPAELDPALGAFKERTAGRVRLWVDRQVAFNQRPRIEVPAPANPSQAEHSDGLGAYAVFERVEGFEADGSHCVYFQMTDTAALDGTRLVSQGGLPEPMPMPEYQVNSKIQSLFMFSGRGISPLAIQGTPRLGPGQRFRVAPGAFQGFSLGSFFCALDVFLADSGPHFVSGQVTIKVGTEAEQPAVGAFITFAKSPTTLKRAGQMLQRTGPMGYYILASFLTDELVRGGGQVMAVDKDWGVQDTVGTGWGGPGGAYGKYYHVPTIRLKVTPADQEDRIAPWAELRFEGRDVIGAEEAKVSTDGGDGDIHVVVNGYDNRDKGNLRVEVIRDGVKLADPGDPAWDRADLVYTVVGGAGRWKLRLRGLVQGVHFLEVRVADGKGNSTRLEKRLFVLDLGFAPPVDPDRPPTFHLELEGGLESARPDSMVRVKFSEPVENVGPFSLVFEKQDSAGGWSRVPVKMLGNSGPVQLSQVLHTVFLLPFSLLETGGRYRVWGTDELHDLDVPPKPLTQRPIEFVVAKWEQFGAFPIPGGQVRRVAVLGGGTFVAVNNRIHLYRVGGATTSSTPVGFGVTGSPGNDFLGQEITDMRVFRQVPIEGSVTDLLLVTTAPPSGDWSHNSVLWAFSACSELIQPRLLFAVSLGPGVAGYSPTLDCRGGLITVGRLTSSMAVISADAAFRGWKGDIHGVKSPAGANQKAIVQPFYLMNPEGSSGVYNPGVAMIPPQRHPVTGALLPGLPIAAGGLPGPVRGLPNMLLNTDAQGALTLDPPFLPGSGAGPDVADARSRLGPLPNGAGATRIAVLPNLQAKDPAGESYQTSLALGLSSLDSGFGGPSLVIVDELDPRVPVCLGRWPTGPLDWVGKTPVPYELPFVTPSVDPATGLVAVPVRFKGGARAGQISWFVLDFSLPHLPRTVARIDANGQYGSLHNGILAVATGATTTQAGVVQVFKVVNGLPGVDEGECYSFQAKVDIAMDGGRTGEDDLIGKPDSDKYLFWVNDDYDYKSWKFEGDYGAAPVVVEDDEAPDANVRFSLTSPAKTTVQPNCDDGIINCMRDLEDFTRVHLRVDKRTASLPGVTYWLRFENVIGSEMPAINVFEAVDKTSSYLSNGTKAEEQIAKWPSISVGVPEAQVPNSYIKTDGAVSPFILEGKRKGIGDLTFKVKLDGAEVGRSKVRLDLRPAAEFVEKFSVDTTQGDMVQTEPIQAGPCTYMPELMFPSTPGTSEYVLFVHGWNTTQWEKDRWAETVFKRLWWLGYRGHLGSFQWPTLVTATGLTTYDQSEHRAWYSAEALKNLIIDRHKKYPGQIRVIAHSMGNIVMGEALRKMPDGDPMVHSYIATQAAVPAHMYDNTVEVQTGWGPFKTPDVYSHYDADHDYPRPPLPGQTSNVPPYFGGNFNKVGRVGSSEPRIFNYFNEKDWALDKWEINNKYKPDGGSNFYFYKEGDKNSDSYFPNMNDYFYFGVEGMSVVRRLRFPEEEVGATNDRYEIFARCAKSRSKTVGATPKIIGFKENINLQLFPFWFDSWHYSHSRQFRSNIVAEWWYWKSVGFDFKLEGKIFEKRFD